MRSRHALPPRGLSSAGVSEQPHATEALPHTQFIEVSESTVMLRLGRMLSKDLRRNYYVDAFARVEHGEYPKWVLRLRRRIHTWEPA